MRTPRIVFFATTLLIAAQAFAGPATVPFKLPAGAKPTAIEVGPQGDIYVAGAIWTPYPNLAISDSFIARYNPGSNAVLYLTRFGAPARITQNSLAIDATGVAYLAADAQSAAFPTTSSTPYSGSATGVVVKIANSGQIVYSTMLPGTSHASAIAINASGEAYVTGSVDGTSTLTSTTGAAVNRANSAFVAKLDATGANLSWVNKGIGGVAIALDAQQNVYVAGSFPLFNPADATGPPLTTTSIPHPTPFGSCIASFVGSSPCGQQHLAKLDPTGSQLLYGVYLTGLLGARPSSIAVDAQGDLYVAGYTASNDFPVTPGAVGPFYHDIESSVGPQHLAPRLVVFEAPPEIGFVSEINPDATSLIFSTYLESNTPSVNPNIVTGVLTRDTVSKLRLYNKQVYVAGVTNGAGFPGLSDVSKSCVPAAFLLRVSSDGKSVDQAHNFAIPNAANAIADAGSALISSIALDALGQIYQIGPFDGIHRLDPTVADPPPSCVTDSATYQVTSTVAPGQILSIFGSTLGTGATAATPTATLLPTMLGNTTVDFDGFPGKLLYASPQQVNVMVPYEIAGIARNTMSVKTTTGGTSTVQATAVLDVVARNPSVFGLDASSTICGQTLTTLIRLADGTFNSCTNASPGGSIVTVFINGGGIPGFAPISGQISPQTTKVNVPVTATLTLGASYTTGTLDVVNFSLEPGSVSGVWRLDLRVPGAQNGVSIIQFTVMVDGVPSLNRNLSLYVK